MAEIITINFEVNNKSFGIESGVRYNVLNALTVVDDIKTELESIYPELTIDFLAVLYGSDNYIAVNQGKETITLADVAANHTTLNDKLTTLKSETETEITNQQA